MWFLLAFLLHIGYVKVPEDANQMTIQHWEYAGVNRRQIMMTKVVEMFYLDGRQGVELSLNVTQEEGRLTEWYIM